VQYFAAAHAALDRAALGYTEALGLPELRAAIARHYRDEIVPLRKRISEETLLRYNGMLASVFELLADSRQQVAAVNAYIESVRDFWLAESNLQMALTGRSPGGSGAPRASVQAAESAGALMAGVSPRLAAYDTVIFVTGLVRLWLLDASAGGFRRSTSELIRAHLQSRRRA